MQKPSKQVSPVLEEHFRFLLWLVPALERFPKSQRFLLGDRIQGLGQEVLECLIEANYSRDRRHHLARANMALDDDDERIKREGLVLILKELHDKLDALVLEAYGWTDLVDKTGPSDDVILERLVRLNAERKAEEARGLVHWLRPDYQIPRFGSDAERARLEDERRRERAEVRVGQSTLDLDDDLQEMKPKFPTGDELAETAAVMRVLAVTPTAITIPDIARHFSQGRQIEKRVGLTIMALARLGHIAMPTTDAFMLRQAG